MFSMFSDSETLFRCFCFMCFPVQCFSCHYLSHILWYCLSQVLSFIRSFPCDMVRTVYKTAHWSVGPYWQVLRLNEVPSLPCIFSYLNYSVICWPQKLPFLLYFQLSESLWSYILTVFPYTGYFILRDMAVIYSGSEGKWVNFVYIYRHSSEAQVPCNFILINCMYVVDCKVYRKH